MMNGKEYLESLRDNRVVYLNGEKIDDVTTHSAYENSARSIAECMMLFMMNRWEKF